MRTEQLEAALAVKGYDPQLIPAILKRAYDFGTLEDCTEMKIEDYAELEAALILDMEWESPQYDVSIRLADRPYKPKDAKPGELS